MQQLLSSAAAAAVFCLCKWPRGPCHQPAAPQACLCVRACMTAWGLQVLPFEPSGTRRGFHSLAGLVFLDTATGASSTVRLSYQGNTSNAQKLFCPDGSRVLLSHQDTRALDEYGRPGRRMSVYSCQGALLQSIAGPYSISSTYDDCAWWAPSAVELELMSHSPEHVGRYRWDLAGSQPRRLRPRSTKLSVGMDHKCLGPIWAHPGSVRCQQLGSMHRRVLAELQKNAPGLVFLGALVWGSRLAVLTCGNDELQHSISHRIACDQLHLFRVTAAGLSLEHTLTAGTRAFDCNISLSPDGEVLAAVTGSFCVRPETYLDQRHLALVHLATGSLHQIALRGRDSHGSSQGKAFSLRWAPDSSRLLVSAELFHFLPA